MKFLPAAHILMPLYNADKYVISAIQSVAEQDYPELKLIIINDGSTDNSLQKIQLFLNENPNLQDKIIIKNISNNRGTARTRQELIELSKEKNLNAYIFWLDADDKYKTNTFVSSVITQMQQTRADVCLFNFSVIFEDENQKINAVGLLKEKENLAEILNSILSLTPPVNALKLQTIMDFTSLGWTKAYAPWIEWPKPEDYPFEDFVYMAILLQAKSITALPGNIEPIEYLRRSTSVCGQRRSENFTLHIPTQLKLFFETVQQQCATETGYIDRLELAKHFVTRKLEQYEQTLNNIIKAKTYPDIDDKTREIYKQRANEIHAFMDKKLQDIQNDVRLELPELH